MMKKLFVTILFCISFLMYGCQQRKTESEYHTRSLPETFKERKAIYSKEAAKKSETFSEAFFLPEKAVDSLTVYRIHQDPTAFGQLITKTTSL